MHKIGKYNNYRVKALDLSTTSKTNRYGRNKFRVKGQIAKIYIQKHYITVRPAQLVVPIVTSFEYNKKNTHTITLHFRTT